MAQDKNWPRWIFASLCKHFDDNRQTVKLFIEGADNDLSAETDYFEFRMNGPLIREMSKDFWKFEVVVNILIIHKFDNKSIHTLHNLVGIASAAFQNCIPVFKYGVGPDDNRLAQLGSFVLDTQGQNGVEANHFGQVGSDTKEMQSSVEAAYCMHLET